MAREPRREVGSAANFTTGIVVSSDQTGARYLPRLTVTRPEEGDMPEERTWWESIKVEGGELLEKKSSGRSW